MLAMQNYLKQIHIVISEIYLKKRKEPIDVLNKRKCLAHAKTHVACFQINVDSVHAIITNESFLIKIFFLRIIILKFLSNEFVASIPLTKITMNRMIVKRTILRAF